MTTLMSWATDWLDRVKGSKRPDSPSSRTGVCVPKICWEGAVSDPEVLYLPPGNEAHEVLIFDGEATNECIYFHVSVMVYEVGIVNLLCRQEAFLE